MAIFKHGDIHHGAGRFTGPFPHHPGMDPKRILKLGHPHARGQRIPIDLDEARQLRELGYSWAQIGAYFGASEDTVQRRFRVRQAQAP